MNRAIVITQNFRTGEFSAFYDVLSPSCFEVKERILPEGDKEVVVSFTRMDLNDPGIRAFAAVLDLASDGAMGPVALEKFLLEIFMAGLRAVRE